MRNRRTVIITVSLVLAFSIFSFFGGYFYSVINMASWDTFISKQPSEWFKPQTALFFDADSVTTEDVAAYNRVKNILSTQYYEPIDLNEALSSSIKGLASGLDDPYTVYYTPEEMKQFMESTSGQYVGIGVSVHMDENSLLNVAEVFANSPAKEAGLLKGDKIVKVDNEDVTDIKDADLIIKKIKGEEGTAVKVTVFRPDINNYVDFVMNRRAINITYINSEVMENNIGYIRIRQFDDDIASDFLEHLDGLMAKGIKGLVIDLRDNPGGDYNQVVAIADRIVPKGLIVYMEDRNKVRDEEYSDARELEIPLSVLVNSYSASASEILAAAVKDYNKGTLVGTKTFGKGLVQSVDPHFSNGGGLKYTIARYFTPSGQSIHGIGVTPDVEVELDEEYRAMSIEDIPDGKDAQLTTAINEVMKKLK